MSQRNKKRLIIMGAAGRDFHNFNTCFKNNLSIEVVAFTATQIPYIQNRIFPPDLSGALYPDGIPIYPEEDLPRLIRDEAIDEVVFSYSDVSHHHLMHRAAICTALGADFLLIGAERTMIRSTKPVISVCAVRTGCGKSAVTRLIAGILKEAGLRTVVLRHPMPYGDLSKKNVERFESYTELELAECTLEEMEEYGPLIEEGITVYAGIDYYKVLRLAEKEADVIIWDGGNNDLPFIRPDIEFVLADPHRPNHELLYYPGEANIRRADCIIINKVETASEANLKKVRKNVAMINPNAKVVLTRSTITLEGEVQGREVLVIEDGPTVTHGGMSYGAGIIAARNAGLIPVDPRPYAVGSIKETLDKYTHLTEVVPSLGYSREQIQDLEQTINATVCDAVLVATPVNLCKVIKINKPAFRVTYAVSDQEKAGLLRILTGFIQRVHLNNNKGKEKTAG